MRNYDIGHVTSMTPFFAFIKPNTEKEVQQILNSFHQNINFTYENENLNTIPFLDVSVSRSEN